LQFSGAFDTAKKGVLRKRWYLGRGEALKIALRGISGAAMGILEVVCDSILWVKNLLTKDLQTIFVKNTTFCRFPPYKQQTLLHKYLLIKPLCTKSLRQAEKSEPQCVGVAEIRSMQAGFSKSGGDGNKHLLNRPGEKNT
jgi:hypothetical protein